MLEQRLLDVEVKQYVKTINCIKKILNIIDPDNTYFNDVGWCFIYEYYAGYSDVLDCYKNQVKSLIRRFKRIYNGVNYLNSEKQ